MTTSTAAVGAIQKFKTKPIEVEAIQFTGTNGRDVVEFLAARDFRVRNGGKYVLLTIGEKNVTIRKGEIVAVTSNNHMGIFTEESFRADHTISKHHVFMS